MFDVGQVVTTEMLAEEEEFLESRFYREYAEPRRLRYLMTIELLRTGHRSAGIAGYRFSDQPTYGAADIELFKLLSPHLCKASEIADALDLRTITSQVLEATLDGLAAGVYLTDQRGPRRLHERRRRATGEDRQRGASPEQSPQRAQHGGESQALTRVHRQRNA